MKQLCVFTAIIAVIATAVPCHSQGIYLEPQGAGAGDANVKLYIDISSPACDCPVLEGANADTNPLYIWTWGPNEDRPMVNGQDVSNGQWTASNPNLQLTQDQNNPDLWYFDFLGVSIADFYGVSASQVENEGLSFLIKEEDGSGNPEPKSPDLFFSLVSVENPAFAGVDLNLTLFATGFTRPCDIVNSGVQGDDRLFVVEQPGRIQILNEDGNVNSTPFLNIQPQVNSQNSEEGLLGLAFSPDYENDGYFFVNYTRIESGVRYTRISRFSVNPDNADAALPGSEVEVLEFVQDFANHNGGQIEFGPDGYLYIATGDGGSGGDPNNRSQDIQSFLGKMLRIDVSTLPYSIPDDNPFAFDDFGLDEIWAYGLRNPWKFAFDEVTGDLYIADVGQSDREEVNFAAAGEPGGKNFGWRCYEGNIPFNLAGCNAPDYVFPIMDYVYGNQGNGFRCSITGGRVYNGETYGNLQGKYIATDYCSGEYWILWQEDEEWQVYLSPDNLVINLVAFGADIHGELYAVRGGNNGQVYKVSEACSLLEVEITMNEANDLVVDVEAQEYTWFLDGNEIETTTAPSLTPAVEGVYSVVALTANGCSVTSPGFPVTSLSTNAHEVHKLVLYPNPAQMELRIMLDETMRHASQLHVEVFSVDGRLVHSANASTPGAGGIALAVAHLPKGYYILKIQSDAHMASGAFVKE